MNDYKTTLEYLYNCLPVFQHDGASAYKPGLERVQEMDTLLEHPHRKYKTIHVAGTNGKGSTSHLLASVLQSSGLKVGLYTSPHLIDFSERIRVDGQPIETDFVIDFVNDYLFRTASLKPSFFEWTMMMAFEYFAQKQVDVAVIEVGLGGRLDSTNIISPDLSIITNIGFDHMALLGNTLPEIAGEKAGIIKPGIPVIIGRADGDVRLIFEQKAKEVNAPIYFAQESPISNFQPTMDGGSDFMREPWGEIHSALGGLVQSENSATVLCAVDQLLELGYKIAKKDVQKGFKEVCNQTGLMGRWQIIQTSPRIICDTGHNPDGITQIARQLSMQRYKTLRMVIGMVSDKDITAMLELLPKQAIYYFTQASVPRALPCHELEQKARMFNLFGQCFSNVESAIKSALAESHPEDFIFVGGSSFIVADLLTYYQEQN